ncbi:MAG: DUF998 domain-containing protein [Halobacteria archaeon]
MTPENSSRYGKFGLRNLPYICGVASPLVAYVGILLATILTPGFTWTSSSLSWLGSPAGQYNYLFNYSIIAGALIGLPFAAVLFLDSRGKAKRFASVLLFIALVGLLGVGVFHLDVNTEIHSLSALVFFIAATFALYIWGSAKVLEDRKEWGLFTIWLGILHVLGWVIYSVQELVLGSTAIQGIAIPESWGAALFGLWVIAVARKRLGYDPLYFD